MRHRGELKGEAEKTVNRGQLVEETTGNVNKRERLGARREDKYRGRHERGTQNEEELSDK